eukprot:TRINITY_DN11535_c0_g1_i2.p1 TRINITY_DN11535_c0_g1~~TRINITY_DN11535_c0_g1_i2.p1  ORF type:complete len:147 (-),score=19.79 TRINITY_DN11535_c0_g1_i2:216-656(-)
MCIRDSYYLTSTCRLSELIIINSNMNTEGGCFIPNMKNTGGYDCLDEMMYRHHERMVKVKPTIKITPPFSYPGNKKPKKKINAHKGAVKFKSKARVDTKMPKVLALPKNLPITREKNDFTLQEHIKELNNLHNRLQRVKTADVFCK